MAGIGVVVKVVFRRLSNISKTSLMNSLLGGPRDPKCTYTTAYFVVEQLWAKRVEVGLVWQGLNCGPQFADLKFSIRITSHTTKQQCFLKSL
jgi:hypothetical protein